MATPSFPQAYQPPPGYQLVPTQGFHPQAPTQPQAFHTDTKVQSADLSTLLKLQEQGRGQPGQGSKTNPDPCPGCGGPLFIENLPNSRKRRGPPPAPHCFSCGYNGLFDQGIEANWAAAV